MKKYALMIVAALMMAVTFNAISAEDAVTVVGKIATKAGDDGVVTSAKLVAEGGETYVVSLDADGQKLIVAATVGDRVSVTGTVTADGETKSITVKSFKVLPAEEAKKE